MNNYNFKSAILAIRNSQTYQQLSALYERQNVFNILKIERNENRHSAFLCWLLNPQSDHALGKEPIKKLLALYAYQSKRNSELDTLFITGNYDVEVEECSTEKQLSEISGKSGQDRADIWLRLTITDAEKVRHTVPVIVENKVYASEGKDQTTKYHEGVCEFQKVEGATMAVEIYLTPEGAEACGCDYFTNLTYQQLLDHVIEPLSYYPMPTEACSLIKAYIQNLGMPATKSMDVEKDPRKLSNSILAISSEKRDALISLYEDFKPLYDAALTVAGGAKAEKILGCLVENSEDAELLQNFWDCNISLFNTILYVCKDRIAAGKEEQLMEIFRQSRRDTTRYMVQWDASGNGTDWKYVSGYEKSMSKGKAVAVFFMKWMELSSPKSIAEIRDAFPTSLNTYYSRNQQKGVYDSLVWFTADDIRAKTESGFEVDIVNGAGWDLYPITNNPKHDRPFGLGYGPVYEGFNCIGKAMIAKMWRKDDFENLIRHIDKNAQKYFSRVRIINV